MNFWHIQLHPNDNSTISKEIVKKILREKSVIGIGEWDDGQALVNQFKNEMHIGDIVAVKDGSNPIALVRIKGNYWFERLTKDDFDWFPHRRKVEVLDFYEPDYNFTIPQPRGTLSICKDLNTDTAKVIVRWYRNAVDKQLEENIKLLDERKKQIKDLWDKFKNDIKNDIKEDEKELNDLIAQWGKYKTKIENNSFTLYDYTNTIGSTSARMPGGYLCNFLERTTRKVLGSSKPGTAFNFEVKLNNDNETYYIKRTRKENATREEAEAYFNENIKSLLKKLVEASDPLEKIGIIESADYSAKQILMKLSVLDNLSDFLYIYSSQSLDELYNDFKVDELYDNFIDGKATDFEKNHQLCTVAKKLLKVNEQDKGELILLSRFLWRYVKSKAIADTDNPNVILYGPPGTGKTYSVIDSLDFVCQGETTRYEILQFHPSFTYEDFIEGIKPKGVSKDGNIRFELVNGVFKNFCIKAKNRPKEDFYFVVDEINRANLSTVFGETLSLLEKDYRHNNIIDSNKNLIRTQYSTLIEDLIKEDKNKYKHLAYKLDNDEVKFGVPQNVFFIGMMNDVDKSIDAFDLALRRRFKWIRKDCDYNVIEKETRFKGKEEEEFNNINQYIKSCEKLNNYISNDLGLGKSYEFGHSFFMKMSDIAKRKDISPDNVEVLFNLYLRPTLKEYLRAVFAESELDNKLNEALSRFKEPIEVK